MGYSFSFRLACIALAIWFLPSTAAVATDVCGSADRMAVALRFVQTVYPELKGRDLAIALTNTQGDLAASEADDLGLRFDKPTWHPPGETNGKSDAMLAETMENMGITLPFPLRVSFIETAPPIWPRRLACHPIEFRGEAGLQKMGRLQETINPHPEWSDAQELEEARRVGLRYGPEDKDVVLRLIPLKELVQFYGPLKIKSAEFFMNGGRKCAGCSFVLPRWEIKLSATHATGWLSITIEPFFGRITSLSSGE